VRRRYWCSGVGYDAVRGKYWSSGVGYDAVRGNTGFLELDMCPRMVLCYHGRLIWKFQTYAQSVP